MTIKEKFNRIDQSKLEPNQVSALKIVIEFTENFKTKDESKIKVTNDKLDNIIEKLLAKNPDAIKPIASAKKASSTKAPKRNVFSVAKEIQKSGESFEDAKKRASQQMKDEKAATNKVVANEMKSLLEYIKKHKELEGIHGTDLKRDSVRYAKVGGRRISKNGNVYYENRENRMDRLAPNYPKHAPLLELGGDVNPYDLAGHLGGTFNVGQNDGNISGTTGTHYTGLVGETGAMSAGEMFKRGGKIVSEMQRTDSDSGSFFSQKIGTRTFTATVWEVDNKYAVRIGGGDAMQTKVFENEKDAIEWAKKSLKEQVEIQQEPQAIKDYVGKHFLYADELYYIGGFRKISPKKSTEYSEKLKKSVKTEGQYKPEFLVLRIRRDNRLNFYSEEQTVMESNLDFINLDELKKIIKHTQLSNRKLPIKFEERIERSKKYFDRFNKKYALGGSVPAGEMFAKGGKIKLGDVVEVREPNYGYDSDYYVVDNKAGYDRSGFLISETRKRVGDVFDKDQLHKIYALGGSVPAGLQGAVQNYTNAYANEGATAGMTYEGGGKITRTRKEYLEQLGGEEAEVWDEIGATSGGEIRRNKTLLKEYAEGVEKLMRKMDIGRGSFDQEDYDFLTDENWHLLNDFLVWNNYYEPTMTISEKKWRKEAFEKDPKSNYVADPSVINIYGSASTVVSTSKKYVPHYEIASVTVKKGGKEVTYKGSDVLNGANELKKGGDVSKLGIYIAKRDVVSVTLKNGDKIKPANGYWIAKKAPKMARTQFEDSTYEFDEGGFTNEHGIKVKSVARPKEELPEAEWMAKHSESREARTYSNGGHVTFDEKSHAIAEKLEFTKVEPKYQKEYGKTYSEEEAEKAGDRIAGSMIKKEKMAGGARVKKHGGSANMKIAVAYAKSTRKAGESWTAALKRGWDSLK